MKWMIEMVNWFSMKLFEEVFVKVVASWQLMAKLNLVVGLVNLDIGLNDL